MHSMCMMIAAMTLGLERPDVEFRIFQFPADQIPRIDGSIVEGPSLSDLVIAEDPALDAEMRADLAGAVMALGRIKTAAEAGFTYDMMLEQGNEAGEALIMGGVNGLIDQTRTIERVIAALGVDGIEIEGSDSLDDPDAVFQYVRQHIFGRGGMSPRLSHVKGIE